MALLLIAVAGWFQPVGFLTGGKNYIIQRLFFESTTIVSQHNV